MRDPTIQKLLEETTLDPPASAALAGQRPCVDLPDPSGNSPKKAGPGRPKAGVAVDAAEAAGRNALEASRFVCPALPPLPHALAQNSAQRKQAGEAGPAPAAGEPLALQRLLRVVATREPDSRPPPRWIPRVSSCIAIFVLVSGHFEPRCKERSIICR